MARTTLIKKGKPVAGGKRAGRKSKKSVESVKSVKSVKGEKGEKGAGPEPRTLNPEPSANPEPSLRVESVPVAKLAADPGNPRVTLTPADPMWGVLRDSIERFGFVDPLIYNARTGRLVGGHQRLAVGIEAFGWTEAPCVIVDLDDDDAAALNLVLNRARGEWDRTRLAARLAEIQARRRVNLDVTGFDRTEIAAILAERKTEQVAFAAEDKREVIVTCTDAEHQRQVVAQLEELGLVCRAK